MALPMLFERRREKEDRSDTSWVQTQTVDGVQVSQVVYPAPGNFVRNTMYDFNNKNWRKPGNIVMSPMSLIKESRASNGKMELVLGRFSGGHSYQTTMVGDFSSSGFESSVVNLFTDVSLTKDMARMAEVAFAKTVAKVNDTPLCTGEFLHDLGKTVETLRRPFGASAKLLAKVAMSQAKHLKKSGVNVVQASANAWLENSYGVQPILLDIANIVESTGEFSSRNWNGNRVARTEEHLEVKSSKEFVFGQTSNPQWVRAGSASCNHTIRSCGGMIYSVAPSTPLEEIVRVLGLRPRDIPSTIWEIIPLSFVVDWFINTDKWLSAVVPDPRITRKGQWVTTISDRTISVDNCKFSYSELQSANPDVYVVATASMNGFRHNLLEVSRDVDPSIGSTPVLIGKPLSVPHSISAASLACQQLIRSFGKFSH